MPRAGFSFSLFGIKEVGMNYRRWGWVMLWLVSWLWLVAPVAAQSGSIVIDDNGVGIDQARVRTAAQQVTRQGANVVVVVTKNGGSGDGLTYLTQRLKALNAAPSANVNDLPANIIIYYVSFSPQVSYIYYGRNFRTALGGESENLRMNYLNAGLKRNDPTSGLVDVLTATSRVVADPVAVRSPAPSGGVGGLVWLIAAVAIGGLLLFVVPSFLRRRSSAAQASDALSQTQSRLTAAKQAAGVAIADLGRQMSDATEKQRFDKVSYPATQVQDLERRHRAAEAQFRQLQVQFDDIGEQLDAKPNPTVTDLEGAAGGYDGVRTQVEQISQSLAEMDRLRKEFDAINAQAPAEVDRAKK